MTLVRPEAWRPQSIVDLEPRAWEALRQSARSVLVTASAGAGKTEFLAQKAAYLLQTGICPAPKRILAISFKRDAARNLANRVERRCPAEQARRFDSMTFDAFTKHLLDQFRAAIPEEIRPPARYRIVFPGRRDLSNFLSRHGYHGINPDHFERAIARTHLPFAASAALPMVRPVELYWQEQYSNYDEVLLSFPMINRLVDYVLRESTHIRRALQMTYPLVFLDEFQDTTFSQFELVQAAFSSSGAKFTAVGDDKQRIMGWAGARPDAFAAFEAEFDALRIHLLSNWRSHEDLVRLQHVVASRIDPTVEYPQARGTRAVSGEIAAIWRFATSEEERSTLAAWMLREIQGGLPAHELAILVRLSVADVEAELSPAFHARGLSLRNVDRRLGDISIQDLLGEDLTGVLLPLLRLGSCPRHAEAWSDVQLKLRFLEALSEEDEIGQQRLLARLERFLRDLRPLMTGTVPDEEAAALVASRALHFVGEALLRQAFPAYQRSQDFERVRNGFELLLRESAAMGGNWSEVLDRFEGLGQIPLMTVHKSKGLEFHTMIFYGLDNRTWWSLTPHQPEELNSFFVAFTRAKQRAFFTRCNERGQGIIWLETILDPAGLRQVEGSSILVPSHC